MSKRYAPSGDFREVERRTLRDFHGNISATAVVLQADALDKRTGTIYNGGCEKVVITTSLEAQPGRPKPRGKTFFGEMAWADSRRHAEDAIQDLMLIQDSVRP